MKDQPIPNEPLAISCESCVFSRLVRPHPQALDRVRMCHFLPPTPISVMTQNGPTLLPSTHPPVLNIDWCAQHRPRPAGESEKVEEAPRISLQTLEDPPRLKLS